MESTSPCPSLPVPKNVEEGSMHAQHYPHVALQFNNLLRNRRTQRNCTWPQDDGRLGLELHCQPSTKAREMVSLVVLASVQ